MAEERVSILREDAVFVGGGGQDYTEPQYLPLKYSNRHGLVSGATGTGKTVTLQILAEGFSRAGVPVFLADVKGDLAGLARPGSADFKLHDAFMKRARTIGFDGDYRYEAFPVVFWDVFGRLGHPVRTTIAEMGPLLLSRLLDLNETQEGIVNIAFRLSDEEGMPLLDLKDFRALLVWIGEHARELTLRYGNISHASIGAIQRRLLVLENEGGAELFGEPALALSDLMRRAPDGRGHVNILAAEDLMVRPRLYATFLLWLLSELFEELPEVGDPDRPRLVLFFDEAHLLFEDAPKTLLDKIEQVARLIRSKGVGVFFVSQNPYDIAPDVLGQLGNRIQHAMRAYTGRERREILRVAETYRANPRIDVAEALTQLGVGEALTSFLEKKGVPGMVERTLIRPPSSRLGTITEAERQEVIRSSPLYGIYEKEIDRESAYEILARRAEEAARAAREAEERKAAEEERRRREAEREKESRRTRRRAGRSDSLGEAFAKSLARSVGTRIGSAIIRGILGGIFRGR